MGTDGSDDSFLKMPLLASLVLLFKVLFMLIALEAETDDAKELVLVLSIIETLMRKNVPHHLLRVTTFQYYVHGEGK
jgi:hypothetical protein